MTEVIVFPDVEQVAVDYLDAELSARGDTASVHTAIPSPRPDRFVRVLRVGGPRRNLVIDEATIVFESWAARAKPSHDLAQLVRALVFAMTGQTIGGVDVKAVGEVGGLANLPDPVSDQARYTFTASVQCRGTAI